MNDPTVDDEAADLPRVRVWVDPGCPWAWQTAIWLIDLRDQGVLTLEWRDLQPRDQQLRARSSVLGGGASATARRWSRWPSPNRGRRDAAFEAYYTALGRLRHDEKREMSPELVRKADADAGMHGLVHRAIAHPDLPGEIAEEYERARELNVFGVPTLQLLRREARSMVRSCRSLHATTRRWRGGSTCGSPSITQRCTS